MRLDKGAPHGAAELIRPNVRNVQILGFTHDGSYFYGSQNGQADVYVAKLNPANLEFTAAPAPLTDRFVDRLRGRMVARRQARGVRSRARLTVEGSRRALGG